MDNIKFKYYTDPGHSWLEVPDALISQLKLVEKISGYSYHNLGRTYLECDCDMAEFIDAWEDWTGKEFSGDLVDEIYQEQSKIRGFGHYRPELVN